MYVLTKNYGIDNGKRKFLIYLMDGDTPLECHDTDNQSEREEIENRLLSQNNLTESDLKYMTLEEYYRQEISKEDPLILVFYLDKQLFSNREMVAAYGESVKKYFDEQNDNVRLFFMPTTTEERIECINPVYIDNKDDHNKLLRLVDEVSQLFQVGVDNEVLNEDEDE
jgi:hypothetical protein